MTVDRRREPTIESVSRSQAGRLLRTEQRKVSSPARRTTLAAAVGGGGEVVFNQSGPIVVDSSGHWTPPGDVTLTTARVRLATAGSATTTSLVKVGASTVGTITLASGATTATVTLGAACASTSYVWLDTTAAGTAAEDLVVVVEYL